MTRIYIALGLLAALLLAGWRVHHAIDAAGFARGQADGKRIAAAAEMARDEAKAEAGQCAVALRIADAQLVTEQEKGKEQQAAATRAVAQAKADAAKSDADMRAWRKRYDVAIGLPECAAVMEMQLCAALPPY